MADFFENQSGFLPALLGGEEGAQAILLSHLARTKGHALRLLRGTEWTFASGGATGADPFLAHFTRDVEQYSTQPDGVFSFVVYDEQAGAASQWGELLRTDLRPVLPDRMGDAALQELYDHSPEKQPALQEPVRVFGVPLAVRRVRWEQRDAQPLSSERALRLSDPGALSSSPAACYEQGLQAGFENTLFSMRYAEADEMRFDTGRARLLRNLYPAGTPPEQRPDPDRDLRTWDFNQPPDLRPEILRRVYSTAYFSLKQLQPDWLPEAAMLHLSPWQQQVQRRLVRHRGDPTQAYCAGLLPLWHGNAMTRRYPASATAEAHVLAPETEGLPMHAKVSWGQAIPTTRTRSDASASRGHRELPCGLGQPPHPPLPGRPRRDDPLCTL